MNHFTLLPKAGRQLRNAIYIRFFVTVSLSVVAIIVLPLLDAFPFDLWPKDWSSYIYISLPVVIMYFLDLRKASNTASSYKLTVSDELITREVRKSAMLSIPVRQIRFITKCADGSYVITGNDMLKPIVVPVGIERAEELEGLLARLTPVTMRL
ncbi:MAG TPA: hypothetical protein VK658_21565 [Chryseolinea sp.]|nr:hypothetical protein [Chryseolinea sp.]